MATNYIAPTWRMPENTNKDKLSNYSLGFDTSSQSINIGSNFPYPSVTTDPYSIAFWIKPKQITAAGYIFSTYDANSLNGIFLSLRSVGTGASNALRFQTFTRSGNSNYSSVVTSNPIIVDEWHHVVVTFNGAYNATLRGFTIYINGSPVSVYRVGSVSANGSLINSSDKYIGQRADNTNYLTDCYLTEFSFFDYALSQDQVTYLYNLNNPMAITGAKPIAYYPIGDNSNPTALAGYPNTSVGGSVFNFDGTGDYLDFTETNFLNASGQSTFSFWIKPNTFDGGYGYFFSGATSAEGGIAYSEGGSASPYYSGVLYWYNGSAAVVLDVLVTENVWNHITIVFDGTSIRTFKNGVLGTTKTITTPSELKFKTIGRYNNNTTHYINGQLSNISVFNTAFTSSQVETLYNNGAPGDISSLNPTAWWKLDSSEIFNSTSTEWSVDNNAYPSVYKNSLKFDGNDFINCGNNSSLSFDRTDSFSFSAWINSSSSLFNGSIFSKFDNATTTGYFMGMNSARNNLRFGFRKGTQYNLIETSDVINTNQWSHVLATYNGNQDASGIVLYVNGVAVNTTVLNNTLQSGSVSNNEPFIIGSNGGATFFDGQISNAAVFNSVLTGSQVETLYNNGTPETSISNSPVSWWKLNNTTTGLIDNGSASNNGTNTGATEYAGFVNGLAGESVGMDSSNLVKSDLDSTTPYSNYSVSFNGGTEYMRTPTNYGSYLSGATSCSVSVWVKVDNNSAQQPVVSVWETSDTTKSYLIRYINDSRRFQFYLWGPVGTLDSRFGLASTGKAIVNNRWYHIVGTWDGTTIKIYQDGVLEGFENAPGGALQTVNQQNFTGRYRTTYFQGDISNQAFWKNTVLTEGEIVEIYNGGVTTDLNNFSGNAPTAWYPMDEKSTYFPGANHPTELYIRDVISDRYSSGNNMDTSNFVGNAPGSNSNGTGSNLDISDLKGDMSNSTKNSYSINMADYGDPNNQGVTPANSGRTTSVPG